MNGRTIQVRTGARLHFGLILGSDSTGWVFGGVGLMLQQPGWQLALQPTAAAAAAASATAAAPDLSLIHI
jgi:predicted sugar kinase